MASNGSACVALAASIVSSVASTPASITGYYERSTAPAELRATTLSGGVVHVSLTRLAKQRSGAILRGDCQVEATGRLRNGSVEATVVPFKDENTEADAAFLAANPAHVRVVFKGGMAYVERENFKGCGQGPTFAGKYARAPLSALRRGPAVTLPPLGHP